MSDFRSIPLENVRLRWRLDFEALNFKMFFDGHRLYGILVVSGGLWWSSRFWFLSFLVFYWSFVVVDF